MSSQTGQLSVGGRRQVQAHRHGANGIGGGVGAGMDPRPLSYSSPPTAILSTGGTIKKPRNNAAGTCKVSGESKGMQLKRFAVSQTEYPVPRRRPCGHRPPPWIGVGAEARGGIRLAPPMSRVRGPIPPHSWRWWPRREGCRRRRPPPPWRR